MRQNNPNASALKPLLRDHPAVMLLSRVLALAFVFAFFWLYVGLSEGVNFASVRNLESILIQSAVYGTAALGATMVIITAGIDLSVGAVIALAVVAVAWVLNLNWESADGMGQATTVYLIDRYPNATPWLAIAAGVVAATLAGLVNGLTIVWLRLAPFIVTLGMMSAIRGSAMGLANMRDIYPPHDTWVSELIDPALVIWVNWLFADGRSPAGLEWLVLPLGVWILLIALVVSALVLRYTRFGRHVYAIGSNEQTARLCGVPVGRTKVIVYALAGFFAGLAALMQFSFIGGIGQPATAQAYELYVIAACVIGGASLMGGEGTAIGSVIGALMITVLYMGGDQAGWPQWVQFIVIGTIIIAAVALDRLRHRRA